MRPLFNYQLFVPALLNHDYEWANLVRLGLQCLAWHPSLYLTAVLDPQSVQQIRQIRAFAPASLP